jgi:hypothetical protein
MIELAIKYLNGELTPEQKEHFLSLVSEDEALKEELIKYHHLLAYVSLLPLNKDQDKTERKFLELLNEIDRKKEKDKNG